jgi:hypothetical protein
MGLLIKKQHKESLLFTLVSMGGSFTIIAIALIKQYVAVHYCDLVEIVKRGDVYIICASMAIAAIYSFYTYKSEVNSDWSSILFWISIFNYTFSLLLYLLIPASTSGIDGFWFFTSILVFVLNFFITYFSAYYQNINIDVISDRNREADKLEKSFNRNMGRN